MEDKNSQRCYFGWENLQWGFCDAVVLHFIFVSSFHFWSSFCCSSFVIFLHWFAFRHHPSPSRGLSPGFSTHFILSAQPIAEWFPNTFIFSTIPLSSYRQRYGFERALITHRRLLPYAHSPTFYLRLSKVSPGAGSPSLKIAGLHSDRRNTGPVHLFIWFIVIHNLHDQNNSFLNSTKYYHKLLVVKV